MAKNTENVVSNNSDDSNKELPEIVQDIRILKQEVQTITAKIDNILDILNTLTFFIEDHDDDLDEEELDPSDSNEGWLPEINDWETQYNSDDDDDED